MANPIQDAINKALQKSGQQSSQARTVDTGSLQTTSKSGVSAYC